MSSSCSHWWHAPIYVAAAASVLLLAAISSSSSIHSQQQQRDSLLLALHRLGFHVTALSLQSIPDLPSSFTLFAIPDAAIALSNLSAAAGNLLRRHAVPFPLPLSTLLSLPRGTLLPTLAGPNASLLLAPGPTLNGLPLSAPNLLLSGPHVVHAIDSPFPISPSIDWDRAIRVLGSKGYVSFSIGLTAAIDSLAALTDVTVFAPWGAGFEGPITGQGREEVAQAVRRHMAVGRRAAVEDGMEMATLEGDRIRVTASGGGGGGGGLEVNGVEVTEAGVYADDGVVVHGIARGLGSGNGMVSMMEADDYLVDRFFGARVSRN